MLAHLARGVGHQAVAVVQRDAEAQAAIRGLNGQSIDGRAIVVNEARPKEDRPGGFGGGGGGGGARRGGGGGYGGGYGGGRGY